MPSCVGLSEIETHPCVRIVVFPNTPVGTMSVKKAKKITTNEMRPANPNPPRFTVMRKILIVPFSIGTKEPRHASVSLIEKTLLKFHSRHQG